MTKDKGYINQSVLVVRPGALGDTILTVPLMSSLVEKYPNATITFLGNRTYKDIVPPGIEFQPIDHSKWMWLFSEKPQQQQSPRPHYDIAYVVLNSPCDVVRNLRATGMNYVITVGSRPPSGVHVVKHLHEGLGLPIPKPSSCLPHLSSDNSTDLVWAHPGSGGQKKCLPLSEMASYAKQVCERTGWRLAVTLGEDDEFLKTDPAWENLVGFRDAIVLENCPIKEVWERLGGAQLYIGNDSGISHLAAGLGIKSVIFFISTDPDTWAPWAPADVLSIVDLRPNTRIDKITLPYSGG